MLLNAREPSLAWDCRMSEPSTSAQAQDGTTRRLFVAMAGGTPQMRRNLSMEDVLGLAGSLTKHSSATFPRTDSEQAFQVRGWAPRFPPTGPWCRVILSEGSMWASASVGEADARAADRPTLRRGIVLRRPRSVRPRRNF